MLPHIKFEKEIKTIENGITIKIIGCIDIGNDIIFEYIDENLSHDFITRKTMSDKTNNIIKEIYPEWCV